MNGHCTYSSGRVKEVRDRARTLSLAWGPHSAWPGVDFMFLNVVKKKQKQNRSKEACAAAAFCGLPSPKHLLSGPGQKHSDCLDSVVRVLEGYSRTAVYHEQFCFVTELK